MPDFSWLDAELAQEQARRAAMAHGEPPYGGGLPDAEPSRGVLSDVGISVARGLYAIPETGAKAYEGIGRAVRDFSANELPGTDKAAELAMAIGQAKDAVFPVSRETRTSGLRNAVTQGVESAATSMAPALAGAAVGSAFGPVGTVAGGLIGLFTNVPTFAAAQYADTMRQAEERGVDPQVARWTALVNAASEGGTELLSDVVAAATGGGSKVLTTVGREALSQGISPLLKQGWKPMLRNMGTIFGAEASTELLNAGIQAEANRAGGIDETGFWDAIKEQAGPIGVASLLFATLGGGLTYAGRRRLREALANPEASPKERGEAVKYVADHLEGIDPDAAKVWREAASEALAAGEAAPFDRNLLGTPDTASPKTRAMSQPQPDRAAELAGWSKGKLNDLGVSLGIDTPGRLKRDDLVAAIVAAEDAARAWNEPEVVEARYREAHAAAFPGQQDAFLEGAAPVPSGSQATPLEMSVPAPGFPDRGAELSALAKSELNRMAAGLGNAEPGRLKRDDLVSAILAAENKARAWNEPEAVDARYRESHAARFPGQQDDFLSGAAPMALEAPQATPVAQPNDLGEIPLVEAGETQAPVAVSEARPQPEADREEPVVTAMAASPAAQPTPPAALSTGEIPLVEAGERVNEPPDNAGKSGAALNEKPEPVNETATAASPPPPSGIPSLPEAAGQQPGAASPETEARTAKVMSGDAVVELPVIEHDGVKTVNVMGEGMPPRYAVLTALPDSDVHQIDLASGKTPAEAVAAARRPPEASHPMNARTRGRALQSLSVSQQNALGRELGIKPGRTRTGFLEAIFDSPELKLREAYDKIVGETGQTAKAGKAEGATTGAVQSAGQNKALAPPDAPGAVAETTAGSGQNGPSAAPSQAGEVPQAAIPEQRETLGLSLGEKIGGSRKDTAAPTGPRVRLPGQEDAVPAWRKRFIAVQVSETGFRSGVEKTYWSIADQKGTLRTGQFKFDTKEEAEAAIPLAAVSLKHRVGKRGDAWEIYRKVTDRKTVVIKDGFASEEDAKRYMAGHAEEILGTKTGFGEEILARPEKVFREGAPRREGPAKGQDFLDTFGFRGVEFGEWNDQAERQEVLNHAYDGLLDLAEILNVPPKALSLNGDLALAFGSRGRGLSSAKAHYERDYGVINLTKLTGAGSLAHEWFHALDHYLARQDTKASSEKVQNKRGDQVFAASDAPSRDYLSHGASRKSQVREELRAAYEKLLGDIAYKAEQYREDTEKAEQFVRRARGYLERNLSDTRAGLAQEMQWGKKRAPATAEQLERFDALATQLLSGDNLALEMRSNEAEGKRRSRFGSYRSSNDILDGLAAIYKEVRGRSGFNAERTGPFNSLAANVQDFARRAKMLEDARSQTEKTKQIPTEFRRAAYLMDQGRTSDYWSEPHELAARAFSAYVEDRVAQGNGRSDFLVYGANNAMLEYRLVNVRPFPEGAEREAINAAFDRFFQTVRTKETNRGIAMFRRAEEAQPVSQVAASPLARAVAEELRRGLAQFPALRGIVDVYTSEADMPADLLLAVEDAGMAGRYHGVFDPETRRIALVAANIPSAKAGQAAFVAGLIRHEGRHAFLDRALGGAEGREAYFNRAAQAMPRDVARWLQRAGLDSNRRTRAEAAEEILVSWSKDGTAHRVLDKLLAKLVEWARAIFPNLKLAKAEMRLLLAQADDFVDGEGLDFIAPLGQPLAAAPAFSRGEAGLSWPQQVDDFLAHRMRPHERLDLGGTPPVIGLLGGHDLLLQMTQAKANKILKGADAGGKHGVSPEVLKQLPQALKRPVVVLKSATWADSLVLVTELPHQGSFLVAAVHLNVREGRAEINEVASVYAKNAGPSWVARQIQEGLLLYRDKTKVPGWQRSFRLQLPTEMPTGDKRKIFTEVDLVKYEAGLPARSGGRRFSRSGALAGVPEKPRELAPWLKDEATATIRSFLPSLHELGKETGVLGKILRSPEYWKHPVLKKLYEIFRDRTDRAHEILHDAFDLGDGKTITGEARRILRDKRQREILSEGVDHADVNEIGPEAMESWFKDHGANAETISLWRAMRAAYDRLLDARLASYRKLVDKARDGYERQITRRLAEAGIPADAARTFDAAAYNADRELSDELAPYADAVKAVVAAARKDGVTIKGQLADVRLTDEKGTEFSFAEMVERMGQLRGFYAPRLREVGDFVVRGQRTGADGTIERFRAHKEWRKSAEKLRLEMARAGWDMEPVSRLEKLPEATQGVIKALELAKTVETAVNQAGEDVDAGIVQAILETLADEVKARGFRSQSIRRSGRHGDVVQGYFKDPVERFARYAGSTAYGLAKAEAAQKAATALFGTGGKALDIRKEGDIYRLAVDYLAENLRNAEAADRVFALAKSVASLKYLGLNPKSALVNLTSMATSVPAALHAYAMDGKGGWARIGREIVRSMGDYLGVMAGKEGRLTAEERAFMEQVRKRSEDDPQFARDALSVYRDTAGQTWSWLMAKAMLLFGATEQFNRGATLLAGYRLARAAGADHPTAMERARQATARAHGVYDRATQPALAWGTGAGARLGQSWYIYKKYGHNYLQLIHELFGKMDWQASLFALLAPAVLGGVGGHVLTALAKALVTAGGGDDPEKWFYKVLCENLGGQAEDLARFGLLGLTGADVSGSMNMVDMPDSWADILGPMGGLAKDLGQALGYLAGGQPGRAAEKALPAGVAKVLQGIREYRQGVTTGRNYPVLGEDGKPIKPSLGESVGKAAGFRPLREARARDMAAEAMAEERGYGERRDALYARYRAFALSGGSDSTERDALITEINAFNTDAAGLGGRVAPITREALLRQSDRLERPTRRKQARLGLVPVKPGVETLDAGDFADVAHPYQEVRRAYTAAKARHDALVEAGDTSGAAALAAQTRLPILRRLVGNVRKVHADMAETRAPGLSPEARARRLKILREREKRAMDRAAEAYETLFVVR